MEQNTFAARIAQYRKEQAMTQEALANELGLTAQAVSKWENAQGYPDVALLPQLADLFGVTIDALFGREPTVKALAVIPEPEPQAESVVTHLPWSDDRKTLHAVLYAGHLLLGHQQIEKALDAARIDFCYEGEALNIDSAFSVSCDSVTGNVTAGTHVNCDSVGGNVSAGTSVTCDDVAGNVSAGSTVSCDNIGGKLAAGGSVTCESINGSVSAGGKIECDEVNGDNIRLAAGGSIHIDEINGSLADTRAGGIVRIDADNTDDDEPSETHVGGVTVDVDAIRRSVKDTARSTGDIVRAAMDSAMEEMRNALSSFQKSRRHDAGETEDADCEPEGDAF